MENNYFRFECFRSIQNRVSFHLVKRHSFISWDFLVILKQNLFATCMIYVANLNILPHGNVYLLQKLLLFVIHCQTKNKVTIGPNRVFSLPTMILENWLTKRLSVKQIQF